MDITRNALAYPEYCTLAGWTPPPRHPATPPSRQMDRPPLTSAAARVLPSLDQYPPPDISPLPTRPTPSTPPLPTPTPLSSFLLLLPRFHMKVNTTTATPTSPLSFPLPPPPPLPPGSPNEVGSEKIGSEKRVRPRRYKRGRRTIGSCRRRHVSSSASVHVASQSTMSFLIIAGVSRRRIGRRSRRDGRCRSCKNTRLRVFEAVEKRYIGYETMEVLSL